MVSNRNVLAEAGSLCGFVEDKGVAGFGDEHFEHVEGEDEAQFFGIIGELAVTLDCLPGVAS